MREASIVIHELDLVAISASAAATGVAQKNDAGELEPVLIESDRGAKVPCFDVHGQADRSGKTLHHVIARGDKALLWLQELATQDTAAQTAAQRERRAAAAAAAAIPADAFNAADEERARLDEESAELAERELAERERLELQLVETAPAPAPAVTVTLTEPTPWAPCEPDDDVEPQGIRAKKKKRK